MSVYDRPMFRRKMGGATGIMASGPELIRRANGGGLNILSSARANPLLTGDNQIIQIPQGGTIKVPFFGQRQPENRFNTEVEVGDFEFGRNPMVTPASFGAIPGTTTSENILADNFSQDTSGTFGGNINQTTGNILNNTVTNNQDIVNEETGDVVTTTEDDEGLVTDGTSTTDTGTDTDTTATQFNFRDIKNKTADEIKNIQNLYSQYSTDLNNLNNANILGKTYDKHKEEYIAALNKRPEEATFEDVRDSAFDLLGFDRESLDEKLTKDQQGSIWLNMMRAGLAMAAGESPNALTNVAKGFQVGLEGYGRDMKTLTDDYREDIDKFVNTLDFDERYFLKEMFDNQLESIRETIELKNIPHSEYVSEMFKDVVMDGIISGINRIRIKSELKKSTNGIHKIENRLFANNSVEKKNGWFKEIDVEQKKTIIDLIRSECEKFRSSLESQLSDLNNQFKGKEVA